MSDPLAPLNALRQAESHADEEGRTWDAFDALEAVQPFLRTGPSDSSVIAFLVILMTSIGFLLWLAFG